MTSARWMQGQHLRELVARIVEGRIWILQRRACEEQDLVLPEYAEPRRVRDPADDPADVPAPRDQEQCGVNLGVVECGDGSLRDAGRERLLDDEPVGITRLVIGVRSQLLLGRERANPGLVAPLLFAEHRFTIPAAPRVSTSYARVDAVGPRGTRSNVGGDRP